MSRHEIEAIEGAIAILCRLRPKTLPLRIAAHDAVEDLLVLLDTAVDCGEVQDGSSPIE